MSGQVVKLLDNAVATGEAMQWRGGRGTLTCACAGFNGATIKLQYLAADGSTWLDYGTGGTYTANGMANIELAEGQIRGQVSAATPSSGVYLTLAGN